jgi:uncharacterized protein (DUF1919 family)
MNTKYCDYGHETEESRLFPIGSNANIIICYRHYLLIMRKEADEQWQELERYDNE